MADIEMESMSRKDFKMDSNSIKRLVPTSNERLVDKQTISRWNTAKLIKSSLTPVFPGFW